MENNLNQMSLREKIGQMMMVGFEGKEINKDVSQLIKESLIGGVILFDRNLGTKLEIQLLINQMQEQAGEANHPYPLFISIDQENGIVNRLGKAPTEATFFPGNMLLGAIDDERITEKISQATARELKGLGINYNLAPDIDINNNPYNPVIGVRSFGESPGLVGKHGIAFIQGHQKEKIITCIKHFPGHGNTHIDSHLNLPIINKSIEELMELELIPFCEAMDKGADSVMVAHVNFAQIDELQIPATISKKIVTGLLRNKLGYDGVIISDCLEMKAISETIGTVEGGFEAVKAGVDILLVSHSKELQEQLIDRIAQAVALGELDEEIINKAVKRIYRLKQKYISWNNYQVAKPEVLSMVGGNEHSQLAEDAFRKGITLVKNEKIIPIKDPSKKILVVYPKNQVYSMVEDTNEDDLEFTRILKKHYRKVKGMNYTNPPSPIEEEEAERLAADADIIIFASLNAHLFKQQAMLLRKLASLKSTIVISLRNPYDLSIAYNARSLIAVYEDSEPALEAVAKVIFGVEKPEGNLPVTIPKIESRRPSERKEGLN